MATNLGMSVANTVKLPSDRVPAVGVGVTVGYSGVGVGVTVGYSGVGVGIDGTVEEFIVIYRVG